jgi:uracil-DNA glycosylase
LQKSVQALIEHQQRLRACTRCPQMTGPPVIGQASPSPILLVGQAPGDKEPVLQRPFAWTAGKTLFKWFSSIGLEEEAFRERVYMAAVCRCFPGKRPKGGDRVPDTDEIATCSEWLAREFELLRPRLLIPVGKLAISQFIQVDKLADVIGRQHRIGCQGLEVDMVPLPHPSGASTWHRMEPGKTLLGEAIGLIERHPAWHEVLQR